MGQTSGSTVKDRSRSRLWLLLLVAAAFALAACDDEPDGRDLTVGILGSAPTMTVGEEAVITVAVTNHGSTVADATRLGVVPPASLTVESVSGPHVAECMSSTALSYCDVGDVAPGETRLVDVTISATSTGTADLALGVDSAGIEPDGDPHPNVTRVSVSVYSVSDRYIEFDQTPPVAAGTEFDVTGVAVGPETMGIPGYYTSVTAPAHLEVVSVTLGSETLPCTPTGSCTWVPYAGVTNGTPVSIRLRALEPSPPAVVGLGVATEGLSVGGTTTVQVVDPDVVSDVHPDLGSEASEASGIVGEPQLIEGWVRNGGTTAHPAVEATVQVPATLHLVSATWGDGGECSISGSTATCEVGAVSSYANIPVEIVVRPLEAGPATISMAVASTTPQDVPDPNPDTTTTTIDVEHRVVDLGLTTSATRDPAVAGTHIVSATIRNHGVVPATGTTLVATLPAGVEIVSASIPLNQRADDYGGCTVDGQVVTCDVGTVDNSYRSQTVNVSTRVSVGDDGPVHFEVTSNQSEPTPDPHPNTAVHDLVVVPANANMSALAALPNEYTPPASLTAGIPHTFQYRVVNGGPSPVDASEGSVTVPDGWTITEAEWARNEVRTPCEVAGTTATCATGPISVGTSRNVYVTFIPDQAATAASVVATASSPLPDPSPTADSRTYTFDVEPGDVPGEGADLTITSLTDPATMHGVGGQTSFRAVVTNRGGATAPSATLALTTPDHAAVEEVTGTGLTNCATAAGTTTCDLGDVEAGEDRVVTITLSGVTTGIGDVVLAVDSATPEQVPDLHPNALSVQVTVAPTMPGDPHIAFDPTPPVAAGTEFEVVGVGVGPDGMGIPGYFINVSVPPSLEVISATLSGTTVECTPTGSCKANPYAGVAAGSSVRIRLRALSPTPQASVGINVSTYGFGVSGHTTVQVMDATITSEVHPELFPAADGAVGVPQVLGGRVLNTGSADHPSVSVTLEVPPALVLIAAEQGSDHHPCTIDGQIATCDIGELPAYGQVPFELVVRPLAGGTATVTAHVTSTTAQDDPDPFPDTATVDLEVQGLFVDLGLTPAVSHTPAVEAAPWVLSPEVTNHGNRAATRTRLVATIPEGVEITSFEIASPTPPDSAGCTLGGQVVTCEVGTLHPGATARVHVRTEVVVGDTGTAQITVTSDQGEPTPDPHTNSLSHALTVQPPRADVWSFVNYGPSVVVEGVPVTLRALIANAGPSTVPSSQLEVTVPADWTITAAEWDHQGTRTPCAVSGTSVSCATGSIASPAGNARDVYVTVVPGAPATGLTFEAVATSPLPDPNPGDNSASRTIAVVAPTADVGITATHGGAIGVNAGDVIDLQVSNAGPAQALDAVVTVEAPATSVIESVDPGDSGFACSTSGQVITCTSPSLAPGSEEITLTLRHTQVGPLSFDASVSTASPEGDDESSNVVTIDRDVTPVDAALTGVVVGSNGSSAAGGLVWVHPVGEAWPYKGAVISADGSYTVTGLAPGSYQVQFIASEDSGLVGEWYDDLATRTGATVFTATGHGEQFVADAELAPAAHTVIRGKVTTGSGTAVGGTTVSAYKPGGFVPEATTTTDSFGHYVLQMPAGQYQLRFDAPAARNLRVEWFDDVAQRSAATVLGATGGGQIIVADAHLAPKEPPTIRGVVRDEGSQPLAGVTVGVYRPGNFLPTYTAVTGADGSYSIPVANGDYQVRFEPPTGSGLAAEWFDDQAHRSAAATWVASALDQVLVADAVLTAAP